jgi:hypothetical protein
MAKDLHQEAQVPQDKEIMVGRVLLVLLVLVAVLVAAVVELLELVEPLHQEEMVEQVLQRQLQVLLLHMLVEGVEMEAVRQLCLLDQEDQAAEEMDIQDQV